MKILLIDDDEVFHVVIGKDLRKHGHDVVIVSSGKEGTAKLSAERFDLIITDLLMPDKDGIEIIQEIRAINTEVKIIAISSGGRIGFSSFLELAEVVGADASLRKPISLPLLLETIGKVSGMGSQ